ncbi:hypothetical protein B0H12DRAFT_1076860 [Mycena haematopus]|nr:hypothetical protein B0H12DRAFT_1076860 [Mycena haematopus]
MDDHEVFLHLGYESVPAPLDVPVYQNPNSALSRAVRRLLLKMSLPSLSCYQCNTDNIECRNNTFGQRCPYCVVGNFPCSFNNLDFWEGFLVTFQQHFIRNWLQNNYTSPPIAAALFMELQILKDFVPLYIGSLTPDVILGVGARAANFHITRSDVIRGVIPPDSTFAVGLVSLLRSLCIPRLIGRLEGDHWNSDVPPKKLLKLGTTLILSNPESFFLDLGVLTGTVIKPVDPES